MIFKELRGCDHLHLSTVVPAKSDSDVTLCLQVIRGLELIDHLCINPIGRIGLIHNRSIDLC